jgi:hypothetical protein
VSWGTEVLAGIRKIVLMEHHMDTLTEHVKQIALSCQDLDRRLVRMEAKFELLERMAAPTSRRSLPEKSGK